MRSTTDRNDPEILRRRNENLWVITTDDISHGDYRDVRAWYAEQFPNSELILSHISYDSAKGEVTCHWLAATQEEAALMKVFWS
jgi:hypothetical protein